MSGDLSLLKTSYAFCDRLARQSGSNFYPCFLLLGKEKRRAMNALYAFMRHTDDLGDSPQPAATRQEALCHWRSSLKNALNGAGDPATNRLLPALADTVHRFAMPPEHLFAVIDGVEMDVRGQQYETFEELALYCRRVASAVGMACLHIWGFRDHRALDPADRCGLAFQLTNILRDLKEDAQQGRLYLPLEDLRQFDYSPDEFATGIADERFLRLMQWEFQRVKMLYREAAELYEWLHPDGRRVFGMMAGIYHGLFCEIRRRPAAVLRGRVRLPARRKLSLAARWLLLPPKSFRLS